MQLKPKMVEKEYTLVAYLNYAFASIIICFALAGFSASVLGNAKNAAAASLLIVVVLAIVYLLWYRYEISKFLHNRDQDIMVLATKNAQDVSFSPDAPAIIDFNTSSLWALATRDARTSNYLKTADWTYVDFSYAVYKPTKGGEYKQATIYYAVMAVDLPRALPNVLFDSKKDRGRQFKVKFDPKQLHQLEGNFNEYFDTYFAEGYTIDSMSFITPDVMQALIAADDYDAEIINNKLMLYGPFEPADVQIENMSQLIANIKKTLMVTAADYRDDRVASNMSPTSVAPAGMFLTRRRAHIKIASVLFVVFCIVYFILSSTRH